MKNPDWIENADLAEGSFSAKAKRAGMSVHDFALDKQHAPGRLGKQARLALVLEKLADKRKAKQT